MIRKATIEQEVLRMHATRWLLAGVMFAAAFPAAAGEKFNLTQGSAFASLVAGKWDDAMRTADRGLSKDPHDPVLNCVMARAMMASPEVPEAPNDMYDNEAMRRAEKSLAQYADELKDPDTADELHLEVASICHEALAAVYLLRQDLKGARDEYAAAAALGRIGETYNYQTALYSLMIDDIPAAKAALARCAKWEDSPQQKACAGVALP